MTTRLGMFGWIGMIVLAMAIALPSLAAKRKGEPADAEGGRAAKKKTPTTQKVELTPEAAAKEQQPRVACIRLSGELPESPPNFSLFSDPDAPTLKDWLERLAKARNDERLDAVALEIDSAELTWAQAQELADAVARLNAVKPVYAYLSAGSAADYLVASAGREVAMDPADTLEIIGLAAEMMFFRGTLDWLGIEPQMIQVGRYKGAAEPFTNTEPSPELRQEYDKLLDSLYDQLCRQIAAQRKLKDERVRQAIDEGPLDAPAARKHKLVDRLVERIDWRRSVGEVAFPKVKDIAWLDDYGKKPRKTLDLSNPFALLSAVLSGPTQPKVVDPAIAIIHADGVIIDGVSGEGFFGGKMVGARTLTKCFTEVAEDEKVKAVIFRINSPGGSAMASELILQAVRRCAEKKPVIVSVSGMAASGGYYIASGGRTIIADPAAIVGSIGVISGKLALTGLMKKVGISTFEITRGRNAGLSMLRPWTEQEQAHMRRQAERIYDLFARRVVEGRGKKIKDIDEVAQGRIFTARQAMDNGLVDQVGGFREAIAAALAAAKLESGNFIILPRPKSLMDLLYGEGETASPAQVPSSRLAEAMGLDAALPRFLRHPGVAYLATLAELLERERVLTALPYHVSIRP